MGPNVWPKYGMFVAWIWTVLGLDMGLFYARVVACLCGFVMAGCVDYFMGISYATIGLENQVVFACF